MIHHNKAFRAYLAAATMLATGAVLLPAAASAQVTTSSLRGRVTAGDGSPAAGVETLRRVIRFCGDAGIEAVTFYAFSTENWSRPKQEVDTLMNLVVEFFTSEIDELVAEGAVIRIIGSREGVPQKVLETMTKSLKLAIAHRDYLRAQVAAPETRLC